MSNDGISMCSLVISPQIKFPASTSSQLETLDIEPNREYIYDIYLNINS